jgi:hypothetical protein
MSETTGQLRYVRPESPFFGLKNVQLVFIAFRNSSTLRPASLIWLSNNPSSGYQKEGTPDGR